MTVGRSVFMSIDLYIDHERYYGYSQVERGEVGVKEIDVRSKCPQSPTSVTASLKSVQVT